MRALRGIPKGLLLRLEAEVGPENTLISEEEKEPYAHDESPGLRFMPDAVVKPGSAGEVSRVVEAAASWGVPVVPRGLGTGLSGGALAVHGGVVISLERMDSILEIDEENLVAVVEPGLVVGHLHQAVEALGLFYPPDPASLESCSIGGNLAENAGGPRAFKYGVTSHYVSGVEVVLPSGQMVRWGGKVVKNVSGYDISHLFVGSEGTLGVFTKAFLRLRPLPPTRCDLLVPFADIGQAMGTVTKIVAGKGIVPALLEFSDGDSFRIAHEALGKPPFFPGADALLIIGIDGDDEEEVERRSSIVGDLCLQEGACDVMVATTTTQKERLWEVRRKLLDVIKGVCEKVELEDVVVPRAQIPRFVQAVKQASVAHGIPVAAWGHAGDGNVHVTLLKRGVDDAAWELGLPRLVETVMDTAVSLGGVITGEHGVGMAKKAFLKKACGKAELSLMRSLKRALDPAGIMNPGKILQD
ncbi:MAG: FAD-linked oxidase C-terminal domain-containing protein [Bacillota bacterium]